MYDPVTDQKPMFEPCHASKIMGQETKLEPCYGSNARSWVLLGRKTRKLNLCVDLESNLLEVKNPKFL